MPEAGPFVHPLPVSLPSMAGFSGLPVMIDAAAELVNSIPSPELILTMMPMVQMIERLMTGTIVPVGKGKTVDLVAPLPLKKLARPPINVNAGLIELLIPISYLDKELKANHF